MPDLPRSHLIAYALAALAVVGFGVRQVMHSRASDAPAGVPLATPAAGDGASSGADEDRGGKDRLVVHVAGAVRRPGVYRLADGLRVDDAVRRAGGARREADLSQLNLAAKLEDGRQVLVPLRVKTPGAPAPGATAGTPAAPGTVGAAPAAPVNLNTATVEQLDTLDGVGPVTAQKILAYREEHGGFGTVDELGQIPGIGPKRLATLRELVTL